MNLKRQTVVGMNWAGLGNVLRQVVQVFTLVVMARVLSPEDFGVYAILMVFVSFMQLLASMGTAQVVIHMDDPEQRMLSSIFYFNVMIGVGLCVSLYALAFPIAAFFDEEQLASLLKLVSFTFIILSLTYVQKALMDKRMEFRRVILIELVSLLAGSMVGLVAALSGWGVFSLVLITIVNSAVLSCLLWVKADWRPSRDFSIEDIKRIWRYTMDVTGFNVINYFARNSDTFLIGKFIGSSGLGLYSLCYRIMLYPLDAISRVIVRVLFPAFSSIKYDQGRLKRAYSRVVFMIALLTFPLMIGLVASADAFVDVLFGDKWERMAPLLMILAPIGIMQSIAVTTGSIYTALGSTRLMLRVGLMNSGVHVASFLIGLPYGVEGVAGAYAVANVLLFYPNLKLCWAQIDLGVAEGLRPILPALLHSLLMGAAVYAIGFLMRDGGINALVVLAIQIISGVLLYAGLLATFCRHSTLAVIRQTSLLK